MDLSGYVLEAIGGDPVTTLFRARRCDVPSSVLVAMPASPETAAASRRRFEHEHALAGRLDPAWAVLPLGLGSHRGQPILVRADPGGLPLAGLLGVALEPARFLALAIALAQAVRHAHASGLIHKDIRPANALVVAGEVRLTGFGLATRLQREWLTPASPQAGTLAYMSPEQTGRMNRSIDGRSDLYSLGITFYEMLTGALPYDGASALDWIHCHIARAPLPPRQRVPGCPPMLEAITLKLLEKRAEDRYQSVLAVERDLRRCLERLAATGGIEPFVLAQDDRPDRLRIPESLYGRSAEVDRLRAAYARVAATGATEVVLVSGPAGVGKSSLVGELHNTMVATGGLFAAGKFDQYRRGIPYATIAEAFGQLVRQILTQEDAQFARWRRALLDAVGPNGRLMLNLVDGLDRVIGEQPPCPELPPQDARHRFEQVFGRVLAVFAQPTHPLVLFLDDLQWLDEATIELVERLATDPSVRHLLIVGACRNEGLAPTGPLGRTLATVRAARRLEELRLEPLSGAEVSLFLADALGTSAEALAPLAALVLRKTGGNPFFVAQFVTALADEGLLAFDHAGEAWTWDPVRIAARTVTDNIADLMTERLVRLHDRALEAVTTLACVGNGVSLRHLAVALGRTEAQTADAIWPAVDAGLVLSAGADFAFSHDKVQEAAYRLVAGPDRAARHLAIARALVAAFSPAEVEERIFAVVDQFARALPLVGAAGERTLVAELHLRAGRRAKTPTAYASALSYLVAGAALVRGETPLAFDLALEQAECEFLTGAHAAADARLSALSERARDAENLAAVTRLRLALYTTAGETARAVDVGLAFLRTAGIAWSPHPPDNVVQEERQGLTRLLDGRAIDRLAELPRMRDPAALAAMEVLASLVLPALITDKNLEAAVILRMARISLEHGNCDASCYAYSQINLVLGLRFGDHRAGHAFGRLACALVERPGMDRYLARVITCFSCYVAPWAEPLPGAVAPTRHAIAIARQVGDPVFTVAAYRSLVSILMAAGAPLAEVEREAEAFLAVSRATGFGLAADGALSALLLARELRGGCDDALAAERAALERHLIAGGDRLTLPRAWFLIHRMQACYLAGDGPAAAEAAAAAAAVLDATRTFIDIADYHFFAALIEAAGSDASPAVARRLAAHHAQMATWAEHCPANFSARAALIAAEIARRDGRAMEALRGYEAAIALARQHGAVQVEAIASELAAGVHAANALAAGADAHLRNARLAFERWGADAVVARLDRAHEGLAAGASQPTPADPVAADALDLAAVIEVSQTVSGEIVLDRLVERLMTTVVEHTGAVRAVLILPVDGALGVVAEALTTADAVAVVQRHRPVAADVLPEAVLNVAVRTRDVVILDDASVAGAYAADPYIRAGRLRSLMCLPLYRQSQLVGVLYLENDLASHIFTPARVSLLRVIGAQAAISMENARLFGQAQAAREQARQAAIQLRQSFDMIPALAWSCNPDGTLAFANRRWHEFTGISETELTGDSWISTFHPDDVGKVIAKWNEVLTSGVGDEIEARMVRADGAIRNFLVRAAPMRDEEGRIVRWYGTNIDIDELKRLEEAQDNLARAARLTAMGELTVSIAHEINQPLMAIVTNAATCLQWLGDDHLNPRLARQAAERIVRDGHRAGDIIAGIRALAKKTPPTMARLDLGTVIAEVLLLTRGELHRRGIAVETDLAATADVLGDRVQMQQVVVNLVLNGIEAMAATSDQPRTLRISTRPGDAGEVVVAVADTGVGLDEAHHARIFEALFTTKPEGIGMGLSICRSIVEAHGGRLWAAPNAPVGTVFSFTIPLFPDAHVSS